MSQTEVAIDGQRFLLNGRPTYAGRTWRGHRVEGLLMNSRMVQATFDDENPLTAPMWAYPDTGRLGRRAQQRRVRRPCSPATGPTACWRSPSTCKGAAPRATSAPSAWTRSWPPCSAEPGRTARAELEGPLEHAQPWHNSALDAGGELKAPTWGAWSRVLGALDRLGMVAILGVYYFGQDERLEDEAAVRRGVQNTVQLGAASGGSPTSCWR